MYCQKAFKIMFTASWVVNLTEHSSRITHERVSLVVSVHVSGFLWDILYRQSVPLERADCTWTPCCSIPDHPGLTSVSQQAIWGERGDWQARRAFQRVLPLYFWYDRLNSHSHYLNSYKSGILSLRDVIRGERLYPFFKELKLYKKEKY